MLKDVYLETRVLTASPLDLVNMLYQHAILCVQNARGSLAANQIQARTQSICSAIAVISELRSSLDHTAGGEISARLESLYEYMQTRLTEANMKQQDQPLAEVESLLAELSQAWSAISCPQTETQEPEAQDAPLAASGGQWSAGMFPPAEHRTTTYWSA